MKPKTRRLLIAAGLMFAVLTIMSIVSIRWIKVYEHVVYFDDLPEHLQGLRILHISDLHSNHAERMNINIWRHIDELDFDMAVITGDIVTDRGWPLNGPMTHLDPHKPYLAALAQRVPTFFVEGNHESRSVHLFKDIMDNLGITFLYNDIYNFAFGGGYLEIIGTKDLSTLQRMNRHTAYSGDHALAELFAKPADFRLVLTHQPQIFDLVKHNGQKLMLAGHTHGGQIRLPFLPVLFAPGQGFFPAYGRGFYYHENAQLYVSSGVGTTYFPLRFWNRPIISIHELSRP